MSKKILIYTFVIIGLATLSYVLTLKENKKEPLTFTVSSLLEELSIDEKIKKAELIIIGEVKATLPSKWKKQNEKDVKNATLQEIYDAEGLFTDSIISVDQILKGDYKEATIRVRSYIGETEQVQVVNESQPIYKKGQIYLLFLEKDIGPTAIVDPGDYISVNSFTAVYEIFDGKAISGDGDEWVLEELVAYIEKSLSGDLPLPTTTLIPTESLTETPLPFTDTPAATDLPTQTPTSTETASPTP